MIQFTALCRFVEDIQLNNGVGSSNNNESKLVKPSIEKKCWNILNCLALRSLDSSITPFFECYLTEMDRITASELIVDNSEVSYVK